MDFEGLRDFLRVTSAYRPAKSLTGIRGSLGRCALRCTPMAKVELRVERNLCYRTLLNGFRLNGGCRTSEGKRRFWESESLPLACRVGW